MATNYDRTVFVNGSEPAINAENLNKITAFCDAIASGGAGSVVSADLALNSNNLSGKGLDAATSTTPDKIPLRDANGIVRNPAVNPNNGLVFAASQTLPEYPDNAAGTTYFNGNFTAADGWTAGDCTLSYSNGKLIMTATAANPRIFRAVTESKTYRVKIKRVIGNGLASRINNSGGTLYSNDKTYPSSGEHTHDFFIGAGASANVSIYGAITGSAAGDIYEISFIYIGDGTYSSRLLDASGNGNHGTVFGATPTADGGLSFDGVNDSVLLPGVNFSQFSYHVRAAFTTGTAAVYRSIEFTSATPQFLVFQPNQNYWQFLWRDSGGVTRTLNGPTANDGVIRSYTFVHTGTTALLYVNGVLFASNLSTSLLSVTNTSIRLGSSGSLTQFYQGALVQPRIYNRALTEAEITALATNPDAYNLDRVVRSITPVPGSVMTRNTVGGSELANLKLTGVASADPNTLDFYEEGSFTPGISFGGATTGITYSERGGKYTRIGRMVHCVLNINLTNKGTATGDARITGLPFLVSPSNHVHPGSIQASGLSHTGSLNVRTEVNTTALLLASTATNGAFASLTNADFVNNTSLRVLVSYQV
jgi:hypothetical protein